MALPDYTFYIEEYHGEDIPADLFSKYAEKADYNLKTLTQNRIVIDQFERQYNLAVCEIADYYYECDLNSGKVLTNESVGNYSVSYAIQPYREYELALQYLGNTGLLATGVYVN
jgi:hypothetical protein